MMNTFWFMIYLKYVSLHQSDANLDLIWNMFL